MTKLTLGICGYRVSRMWMLMGPLTVALHIASNAVEAILIKSTKGFEGIDVVQLILLWCTRPRMAWMVIALIPWQAKDAMYFSVASSSIFSEVVLQVIGSVYMGIASNYARRQKFYRTGRLNHTQHGTDAILMYAGSLLWLGTIAFAIMACVLTLLDVSGYVAGLVRKPKGMARQAQKEHKKALSMAREAGQRSREDDLKGTTFRVGKDEEESLVRQYFHLRQGWEKLVPIWSSLFRFITEDRKAVEDTKKDLRKKTKLLWTAGRKGEPDSRMTRRVEDARSALQNLLDTGHAHCEKMFNDLQEQQLLIPLQREKGGKVEESVTTRWSYLEESLVVDWQYPQSTERARTKGAGTAKWQAKSYCCPGACGHDWLLGCAVGVVGWVYPRGWGLVSLPFLIADQDECF